MKKDRKLPYEEARVETILLDAVDIVTASSTLDDSDNRDDSGWTN